MLNGNNVNDLKEISKYGKASGFLIAKRYNLPTFSNFYIVENEEDVKSLLIKHKEQNDFCMRSDTIIGNVPIGIGGKNGNRESIFEYMKQIEEKSEINGTKGVAIIYWNNGNFCRTYETGGCFYLCFKKGIGLFIDYVGKGWDGSYLSHGTACHECYNILWNEILFLTDKNRIRYRDYIVSEQVYKALRQTRIRDLEKDLSISKEDGEKLIPYKYAGIKNDYFRQMCDKVMIPMYDCPDLQRSYKEYIAIAQIENEKVIVPEVILPSRLKYKERKVEER